ncbi:hypothetical protein ACEQPO_25635 [Bacillus sp. SL00103]
MRGDLNVVSLKGKWSIGSFALAIVIESLLSFRINKQVEPRRKNVKQDTNYKNVEIVTPVNGKFMRYA